MAPIREGTRGNEPLISASWLHALSHMGAGVELPPLLLPTGKDQRTHLSVVTPTMPAAQRTLQLAGGRGL